MASPPLNETGFEDSVFEDPAEETAQYGRSYWWMYVDIFGSIIKLLIYLAAVVSSIYLITILAKFKRLRNRINNLILIYAVLNMLFLTFGTLILLILTICSDFIDWYQYFCIINNIDHLMITLIFYVLTFLATNWYILNYHSEFYARDHRCYKDLIVAVLIVLAILQWLFTSALCFESFYIARAFRYALEAFSFVVCSIILICLSVLMRFREPSPGTFKTKYAFTIPIIVFSLSLPYYIITFPVVFNSRSVPDFMFISEVVAQSLFLLPPIVILYLLGKSNKYFKMGYLKCCKRHAQNYNDDDLDSGSPTGSVQNVAFERNAEVIHF